MRTCNLISRADAVREALRLYRDARETVRKCREAEDDFGTLAFEGQKEAFRWMVMVLMALPAADTDVGGKDNNVPTKEQSDPLTIEQLREMDGEPAYIVSDKFRIAEWNVLNGIGEIVLSYDQPYIGMKCVARAIKFINGREFRIDTYGDDWLAYRRPPEGEA